MRGSAKVEDGKMIRPDDERVVRAVIAGRENDENDEVLFESDGWTIDEALATASRWKRGLCEVGIDDRMRPRLMGMYATAGWDVSFYEADGWTIRFRAPKTEVGFC